MKNSKQFFPYAIIICISLILINNMFYGFSWTDEGLYLSNVHRFFTGDRFLIDDWTTTQFYEPLLLPLYALFVKFNGVTDGIFLFFRIATIIFQSCVSIFAYSVFSKKYEKVSAIFASLLPLIFSRACLNGASYYTIGFETYLLGLLCLYSVFVLSYKKVFSFLSGVFFAFSILCNPFLVLPYIAVSITCLLIKKSREHIKEIAIVWAGTIFIGIAYILFIYTGGGMKNGISEYLKGFYYTYNDPAYKHTFILTLKRLYKMPRLIMFPYIITWLPMILAVIFIKRKFILQILNIAVFFANCFYEKDCGTAVMTFFHFTIFAVLISSNRSSKDFLKDFVKENVKEIFYFILPGMILAYFFCFASDTGFGVCAIGMTICAIGEILVFSKYSEKNAFRYIPLIILFAFTLFFRINLIYRDMKLPPHILFVPNKNVAKIERGSVKGIYTSPKNKDYYDDLFNLLSELNDTKEKKSIFISGVATWAYLSFENLYCAAPTTWRMFIDDIRLKTYFEEFPKCDFPDYVLVLNKDNPSNDDEDRPNDISETWMYKELEKRGYTKQVVKSGILFKSQGE